jgi:hypothetical protein
MKVGICMHIKSKLPHNTPQTVPGLVEIGNIGNRSTSLWWTMSHQLLSRESLLVGLHWAARVGPGQR